MFLGNTPMLETTSPFSSTPTIIETNVSDIRKAVMSGIGMAIGLSIGGFVLFQIVGKKVI